jgi:hypothetical protein
MARVVVRPRVMVPVRFARTVLRLRNMG